MGKFLKSAILRRQSSYSKLLSPFNDPSSVSQALDEDMVDEEKEERSMPALGEDEDALPSLHLVECKDSFSEEELPSLVPMRAISDGPRPAGANLLDQDEVIYLRRITGRNFTYFTSSPLPHLFKSEGMMHIKKEPETLVKREISDGEQKESPSDAYSNNLQAHSLFLTVPTLLPPSPSRITPSAVASSKTPEQLRQESKEKALLSYQKKGFVRDRVFKKKISYQCRKTFAESRMRIGGKFISKAQEESVKVNAQAKILELAVSSFTLK